MRGDMIEVYKILHELYEPAILPALKRNLDLRTRGNAQINGREIEYRYREILL